MRAKRMLAPAVIAAAFVTMAMSAHAGKARQAPAPDCLRHEESFTLSPDGQTIHAEVRVKNACYPDVNMEGTVAVLLGGVELARAALGPADEVLIPLDIPVDALRGQELCIRFQGTREELVRRKLQVTAFEQQDCRAIS